jgi:hypothetical protein
MDQAEMASDFIPVKVGQFIGYCAAEVDLNRYWEDIQAHLKKDRPIYSVNGRSKVFLINLDGQTGVYMKTIDETAERNGFLRLLRISEGRRYFRNRLLLKRHSVASPKVLFFLERKKGLTVVQSMVATLGLQGFELWHDFFLQRARRHDFPDIKRRVLNELSWLTARMHRMGFYISLDGRNVCVRSVPEEGKNNIALLDLDHIKGSWLGKIPRRRRRRNLERLERTLRHTSGIDLSDHSLFALSYEFCFLHQHQFGEPDKRL